MDIAYRNAKLSDAAQLLEWRNSLAARKFSQNSEPIRSEEHMIWLSERLGSIKFEPFYVFELEHKLIGMSRLDLDFESAGKFTISILVDPEQHGKRMGTIILKMTCETFFDLHPDHTIVANVHKNNHVSQKLFLNAGFELQNFIGNFLRLERKV